MLSSHLDFPKDEFLNTLRKNLEEADVYLKQVTKHNIQWIYQSIKHIHNVLIESKQNPVTKLNSLKLIKAFVETCEIPSLNLIEVYILPIMFSVSAYKPQQSGDRRGFRFFIDSGFSPRIPGIQETGIQFIRLSTEILYVCSLIRTKRTLQCQQLNQQSQFVQFFNKLKQIGVTEISSNKNLKYFKDDFPDKARTKYLKKLTAFEKYSEAYTEYFVVRMVQSLQIQQNPLFSNTGKTVSSLSSDLDFKKLLKYGDTFITSPLIQQLIDGLQSSENFNVKRNFLSLLSDFVKWADIEAFIQISYEDVINEIGLRISQVEGQKSLDAGSNIYPEIKGQKDAKKKFYLQFLKSIEVWAICMKNSLGNEEPSIAEELYIYFKIEKKFKFPDNLFLKKIEEDFRKNEEKNKQKNTKVFEKLRIDETSLINTKKSITKQSIKKNQDSHVKKVSFEDLKAQLEQRYQDFDSLFDEQKLLDKKMKKLFKFRDNFESDLQNIDREPPEQQILAVLDDGDALIEHITAIQPFYKDYKVNKITLEEFGDKINEYLQNLQEEGDEDFETSQSQSQSQSHSMSISKNQSNSMSANNHSKSSKASKKLILNKSKTKEILNRSQQKNSKILIANEKLRKSPSIEISKGNIVENKEPEEQENNEKSQIKNLNNKSRYSEKNSAQDLSKLQQKMSRISNNFSNTELEKQKLSEQQNSYKLKKEAIENEEESPINRYNKVSELSKLDKSKMTVKSKVKNLISVHRSNRTNQSIQYDGVRNSMTQNDFSRDIKNIVYKDLIVNKKIGDDGENMIENVNDIINQNPSTISKKDKKKSFLRSSSKIRSKKQSSVISEKRSVLSKESNDDYMMSKKNNQRKLKTVNSQDEFQLKKNPLSSSIGISSKMKLKRELSKLSKLSKKESEYGNEGSKRQIKQHQHEDHYQMRLPVQQSSGKKKEKQESEQTYYGIEQLEMKVKKEKKQFKDCFQVGVKNSYLDQFQKVNQYALFKRENGVNGDYLMMKLKRQHQREKDDDLRGMESRIMKLRSETSRIRRELSSRSRGSLSKRSNSNNTSQNSRQFIKSEKSHRFSDTMRSLSKGKSSHTSKQSIKSIDGKCFQANVYEQYFNDITSNHVKKTFLKPKTLLHSDETLEIGAICRYEQTLKIILFITPNEQLHEFRYTITEQLTLSIKSYPQYYPKIPQKKQVKINMSTSLKAMPFTIPEINIKYLQRGKPKSLTLVLPCPPHRFIEFSNVNPGELAATFEHEESKIIRTQQFRINKNIFKTDKISEYFHSLTLLRKESALNVYGMEGHFKSESFIMKITTKGSSRMVIQGIPKSRPQFLEYLLSSLKYIISEVQ